jgi:protein-S-isoprenylcysteine O-methyltransferase Ste14
MPSGWGLSWGGWLDNRRGEWWLLAQLLLITAHLLPAAPPLAFWGLTAWPPLLRLTGVLILLTALLLAARSLLSLGASLSPLPAPRDGNQLIRNGAYSHCRHPLYQAVLMASLGVVIAVARRDGRNRDWLSAIRITSLTWRARPPSFPGCPASTGAADSREAPC